MSFCVSWDSLLALKSLIWTNPMDEENSTAQITVMHFFLNTSHSSRAPAGKKS